MQGQHTLTVLEHEFLPVMQDLGEATAQPCITPTQMQALLLVNRDRPGFCQAVAGGVRLAQHCGILRLPGAVLEVLPKLGFEDRTEDHVAHARGALLRMLHRAHRLPLAHLATVPQQAVTAPLLEVFVEGFLRCALEQAHQGLLGRYVARSDDLPVLKGRFQAQEHLRRNLARTQQMHCEFDDFTTDNSYNRAVLAALAACRGAIVRGDTQRLWVEAQGRYAAASPAAMTARDVARLPRDRLTRRYAPLLTWCEWLLAWASPSLGRGQHAAPGLLFDMNRLFEAHVAALEQDHWGEQRVVLRQGPPVMLAVAAGGNEVFALKPDITVWHAGPGGAAQHVDRIIDAKWKRLNACAPDAGVQAADLYQVLAYAVRYQCSMVELVYPAPGLQQTQEPLHCFTIPSGGPQSAVQVHVRTVSPWA